MRETFLGSKVYAQLAGKNFSFSASQIREVCAVIRLSWAAFSLQTAPLVIPQSLASLTNYLTCTRQTPQPRQPPSECHYVVLVVLSVVMMKIPISNTVPASSIWEVVHALCFYVYYVQWSHNSHVHVLLSNSRSTHYYVFIVIIDKLHSSGLVGLTKAILTSMNVILAFM